MSEPPIHPPCDGDWSGWLAEHGPRLLLAARQYLASLADAEDVVQEAFIRFWRTRDRAHDPLAYLYACVRTAALDRLKRDASRRKRDQAAAEARPASQPPLFVVEAARRERQEQLEAALQTLPREQRSVLVMKLWGGLTFAQIAEVEAIPAATAASRYRYALEALRRVVPADALME